MKTMSLSKTLSWIAFRREDHLFADPDEIRRIMDEHPERVRCARPARELLKALREGKLPAFGTLAGTRQELTEFNWSTVTEADIWQQAKADYQRRIRIN